MELLAVKEEELIEALEELEISKNKYEEKFAKLNKEDATNFSDYTCYKEVLESFNNNISCRTSSVSSVLKEGDLSFKSKPICQWDKKEVSA